MSLRSSALATMLCCLASAPLFAADLPKPVRMGCGIMTFDTVPGWGLDENGKSQLGPTHGSVVIDKAGNIYTSAQIGVVVFNPDGKVVRRFVGDEYSNIHDMEIRAEPEGEFIYGARNVAGEGIKFNAETGAIVLKLKFPEESGLKLKNFNPTAITVAPGGDIFLSDGYASNHIFRYDRAGKYLSHFGTKGNGLKEFNTAHGMTLDTRYDPPRLLICDRNHQPKGRLLHYDLDGNFIEEVVTGLGMPTSVAIQGDYISVPDLHGRLVILDKTNTIIAVLGHNPDPAKGRSFKVPQTEWIEGVFSGTHGSYWDRDGNLYVQDWNMDGRIMKLVRVMTPASQSKPAQTAEVLFDGKSLGSWQKADHYKGGEPSVKNGSLLIQPGEGKMSGIVWKGKPLPPVNYEITFEAQRVSGSDFFVGLTFPIKESPCTLIMGGWGGGLTGFSSIDGSDASENETTGYMEVENGRWYKVRLRVTEQRADAWVDGKFLAGFDHRDRKVDVRLEVEANRPLGFATYKTTAALRDIRLRELTSEEKAKDRQEADAALKSQN
jgi:hypothetical protein